MQKSLLPLAAAAGLALTAQASLARDYILAPARPDKLVVIDTEKMAVDKVIQIENAGPTPLVPMVDKDGRTAYATVNRSESIVKLDLITGETLGRIELSTPEMRVKSLFGAALSPDGKSLAVYESPVKLGQSHYEVQPTRIAIYDTDTMQRQKEFEAPRQITMLMYSKDGSRIYGLGRSLFTFDPAEGKTVDAYPLQEWQSDTYVQPDILAVWSQYDSSGMMATPFYTARKDMDPADPEAFRTGLLTLDLADGAIDMRDVRAMDVFYFSTAVSPDHTRAFGTYNVLESFDLVKGESIKRVPLPHSYYSVTVSSDGKTVWIGGALGDMAAYDAETLELKGGVDLPENASMSLASVRLFTREDE